MSRGMAGYSNKFDLEVGPEVVRIVFRDERVPIAKGIPASSVVAGEMVVSRFNARELGLLLVKLTEESK